MLRHNYKRKLTSQPFVGRDGYLLNIFPYLYLDVILFYHQKKCKVAIYQKKFN
jgi:hypothetical protein